MECAPTRQPSRTEAVAAARIARGRRPCCGSCQYALLECLASLLFPVIAGSAFIIAAGSYGCNAHSRDGEHREPWSDVCTDGKAEHNRVRLDASCEVFQEEIVVHVTISNQGGSSIVIDQNLMLLMHLDVLDGRGNVVDLNETTVKDGEDLRLAGHKHPLGELRPGEQLRRDVRLGKGFPEFVCATMWTEDSNDSQPPGEQGTGWLVTRRLPVECPVTSVRAVVVRYHASFCSRAGIVRVFGHDPNVYRLYEGPLCQVAAVPYGRIQANKND